MPFLYVLLFWSVASLGNAAPLKILVHPMASFVEQDAEAGLDGIVVRRLQEAFCRMGQDVEIQVRTWNRAYHELKNGKTDALAGVLRNPEREKWFDYSNHHILMPRNVLVVRHDYKGLRAAPGDLSILGRYEMDYVRGYSLMSRLDAVKGKYIPAEGQSINPTQAVQKLIKKRFDVLIIDEHVLRGVLSVLGLEDKVVVLEPAVQETPSYVAFPKTRKLKNIIDRLDRALESMMEDGCYEMIARDYPVGMRTKCNCDR